MLIIKLALKKFTQLETLVLGIKKLIKYLITILL